MAKFKLLTKEDVSLAVRKRGAEIAAALSDMEFFTSSQFKTYAERLADFILRKHKLYSLNIAYDPQDQTIAYTDGKKIHLNAGNDLAASSKLLERRFKTNMGILFHECGHKMFLDFATFHKAIDSILGGSLYGKFETNGDPVLEKAKTELDDVMAHGYAEAIAQVYANLSNIIQDGHDEACMKRCFPGFIRESIETAGEVQMECSPTLNEVLDKRPRAFSVLCSLTLQYAKFGYYKLGDMTKEVREYLDKMVLLEPIIDEAVNEENSKNIWNHLNRLLLQMWPFIRDMFPDQPQSNSQSGSSGQPSGNGGSGGSGSPQGGNNQSGNQGGGIGTSSGNGSQQPPTPEQVKQALEQIAKDVQEAMKANPAPVNGSGKAVSVAAAQAGGITPDASGFNSGKIAAEIGNEKAKSVVQSELNKAQMDAIRNTNLPLIHSATKMTVYRDHTAKKAEYDRIYKKVAPYVRNLIAEMLALLREYNSEFVQHHRKFGPIIEARESYRPDYTFFAKKKLPEDLPNMAMCILIDQSGSMGGEKIKCARETAILLEKFGSEIGIPMMIAGHDVSGGVNLDIYSDYISAQSDKDRYSLAGIESGGCNRDGLPIRVCAEALAARPEEVKLMVVISDGAPNDSGYRGEEARKDISDTVKAFRRKGLFIYGAAIDDDKEIIEEIYGKGFLSIQNLSSLPKTLVRLMRQQILN